MIGFRVQGNDPDHSVRFGWNPQNKTFFVWVENAIAQNDDELYVIWLGTEPGEITDVDELLTTVSKYADLTREAEIRDELLRSKLTEKGDDDGQVQHARYKP